MATIFRYLWHDNKHGHLLSWPLCRHKQCSWQHKGHSVYTHRYPIKPWERQLGSLCLSSPALNWGSVGIKPSSLKEISFKFFCMNLSQNYRSQWRISVINNEVQTRSVFAWIPWLLCREHIRKVLFLISKMIKFNLEITETSTESHSNIPLRVTSQSLSAL